MTKHIPFLAFSLLLGLAFSCKIPLNSINKETFPEGSKFLEYTDTFQVMLDKIYNTHNNTIVIEMGKSYSSHSIDLKMDNDTIRYIGFIKELNMEYSLYLGVSRKNRINSNSSAVLKERIENPDSNDIISYSLVKMDYKKPHLANLEVQFDKRGVTYSQIMDSLHSWTFRSLKESYTKFYNDTMQTYLPYRYSLFFHTYSLNDDNELNSDLYFLPFSIAYFSVFPEKMNNWNAYTRRNMEFLQAHLFDDLEEIEKLIEKYGETQQWNEFALCQMLRYFKKPNADDYKIVQMIFRRMPERRWIDESYFIEK